MGINNQHISFATRAAKRALFNTNWMLEARLSPPVRSLILAVLIRSANHTDSHGIMFKIAIVIGAIIQKTGISLQKIINYVQFLSCPLTADSIRPTPFHKSPSHLIKCNKTIALRIGFNRRVFPVFSLGLAAKRFFHGLTDERHTECLLCWFQKQQFPL